MAGLPTVDGGKGISDRNEGGWIDCVWMRLLARQGTRALQLDRNCSQENTPRTVRDPRWIVTYIHPTEDRMGVGLLKSINQVFHPFPEARLDMVPCRQPYDIAEPQLMHTGNRYTWHFEICVYCKYDMYMADDSISSPPPAVQVGSCTDSKSVDASTALP